MKISLEPVNLDEVGYYFDLFSSARVCRYMDIAPFRSLADSEAFLRFSDEQRTNRRSVRYTIRVDGNFAGTACLYAIYWHQRRASLGYALGEAWWGRGVMGAALREVEGLARDTWSIHRLQATVLPGNAASRALLVKAGYGHEGLLRHYERWEGKGFVDLDLYAKIL